MYRKFKRYFANDHCRWHTSFPLWWNSCLTPTPHPHRGAVQGSACHKRTALPGVGCRRLIGPDLGTEPGPRPPWPPPWHPPRSRDAGERVGPGGAARLGAVFAVLGRAPSLSGALLSWRCLVLGMLCLGRSLSGRCRAASGVLGICLSPAGPNAGGEPRPMAEARDERRLLGAAPLRC